jgi:single-strand DNA-binding protein
MNQQQTSLRLPEQNLVLISGRVTHDAEVRHTTGAGKAVCSFGIAMSRRYFDQNSNEWKDAEPVFVPIVVWGDLATRCGERAKKGAPVYIEGRLQSSSWEDKETRKKRTKIEVIASRVQFLAKASSGAMQGADEPASIGAKAQDFTDQTAGGGAAIAGDDDEDIPF